MLHVLLPQFVINHKQGDSKTSNDDLCIYNIKLQYKDVILPVLEIPLWSLDDHMNV